MDLATIIGIFGSLALVLMSALLGGNSLLLYMHLPSFILVIVGSYTITMGCVSMSDALGIFNIMGRAFKIQIFNEQSIIQKMISTAPVFRKKIWMKCLM